MYTLDQNSPIPRWPRLALVLLLLGPLSLAQTTRPTDPIPAGSEECEEVGGRPQDSPASDAHSGRPPVHPGTSPGTNLDGTDYDWVGGGTHVSGGTDPGDLIDGLGGLIYNASNCVDGQIFWGDEIDPPCEYIVPDGDIQIEITSDLNAGIGIPGFGDYLRSLSGSVRGGGARGGYLRFVLRVGAEAADAGERIAEQAGGRLVTITVTAPRARLVVTCAPAEICVEGQLQDVGVIEKSQARVPMRARVVSASAVLLREHTHVIQQLLGQIRFPELPDDLCGCGAGDDGGGAGGPGIATGGDEGGGGRDCEPIRQQLRETRAQREEAEALRDRLEAEKRDLEEELRQVREAWEARMRQAEADWQAARDAAQRAEAEYDVYLTNLRNAATDEDRQRIAAASRRALDRLTQAEAALRQAHEAMQEAARPPEEIDTRTDEIGAKLGEIVAALESIIELGVQIEALERQLEACENSGG